MITDWKSTTIDLKEMRIGFYIYHIGEAKPCKINEIKDGKIRCSLSETFFDPTCFRPVFATTSRVGEFGFKKFKDYRDFHLYHEPEFEGDFYGEAHPYSSDSIDESGVLLFHTPATTYKNESFQWIHQLQIALIEIGREDLAFPNTDINLSYNPTVYVDTL